MTLSNGRPYLAIPGPSVMPDRVLAAMHRAAPNIYTGALVDLVDSMIPDLRSVAGTAGDVTIYIGNGHAAWEAANANIFSRGDTALVLATGRFGLGWAEAARGMGIDAQVLDFGRASPVDLARVAAALEADNAHKIKAVLATHVDTASTARNDIAALRACMDACNHPALLMVDCIASLGCDTFLMDDWGVDLMVAASQKGLMTPPGLSFVWFNDKARAVGKSADLRTPYWDWTSRSKPEQFYQYFHGTAPTHHLYGLREALNMIVHEEGLENVWARHATLARTVWAAADAWAADGAFRLNMADPAHRGHSVTSMRLTAPDGSRLRDWCEHTAGVTLGIGLGMAPPEDPAWHGYFRLAHMGHVNAHMVLGALAVMDAGLKALDIPHGSGAIEAATRLIASAAPERK
ncbi:pyridoxal-phosphate-dependent aminotransferase family protein [Roseicitreum antarcticum]|uniref:Alanine-glyoxylate transaminase / serine-glyoxylate transaminase / serine-pyruvate transaminase n=1 Tax=Roseicitreum antarcticum TaxID=564137 RepID=A0A1H2VL95_9RHOB|nr:aminotransferase class V-fold PLP-dependent enzyme [Roseicitreum antarcticum]SDW69067.1 alanine-glyoxylate transaminase / serine-glyoxylate transaminase / serine-pyruvate transaminase [Roseicitreum antarcticum]